MESPSTGNQPYDPELASSDHQGTAASSSVPGFAGRAESGNAVRARPPSRREISDGDDWSPLVRTAVWSTLLALVAKAGTLVWVTQRVGVSIRILKWRDLIPYVSFQTDGEQFTYMVTVSSLVMAVVASVVFVLGAGWTVTRGYSGRTTVGWYVGVFVTAETWAIEWIRQVIHPPILRLPHGYWTLLPLLVASLFAGIYYILERRIRKNRREQSTVIGRHQWASGLPHAEGIRGEPI